VFDDRNAAEHRSARFTPNVERSIR
jgi:hypothetical protein